MKKIENYVKFFLGLLVFGLLSACGSESMSAQEVIEKNEVAMDAIDSVELTLNSANRWHAIQVDAQTNTVHHTLDSEGLEFTYNENILMAKDSSGLVVQKTETSHEKFLHDLEFMLHPFDYLKVLDEEIADKFIVKAENEDEITIAYNSEEYASEASQLAEQIIFLLTYSLDQIEIEQSLREIDDEFEPLGLELTIDKSNYYLQKFSIQVMPVEESEAGVLPLDLVLTYGGYSQDFDLVMFEETKYLLPEEVQDPVISSDLTEEEAAAYLDAIIQATVYQNAEGFVELAPESMGADRIKSDAAIFQDTFKSIYVENSKEAWGWTDVKIPDEQHEALAEAFLNAIAKTEYEVIEQKKSDTGVIVTLLVHGMNDTAINEKAAIEMIRLIETEEMSQEKALEKLFEDLIYAYNNVEELEEPVSVDVEVYKINENFIVEQDEYLLGGFVQ